MAGAYNVGMLRANDDDRMAYQRLRQDVCALRSGRKAGPSQSSRSW
jgi:hypothetical protein